MSGLLFGLSMLLGGIGWVWTSSILLTQYGMGYALISFFIPPSDLYFMFMVGTWPVFAGAVGAVVLGGIASAFEDRK